MFVYVSVCVNVCVNVPVCAYMCVFLCFFIFVYMFALYVGVRVSLCGRAFVFMSMCMFTFSLFPTLTFLSLNLALFLFIYLALYPVLLLSFLYTYLICDWGRPKFNKYSNIYRLNIPYCRNLGNLIHPFNIPERDYCIEC